MYKKVIKAFCLPLSLVLLISGLPLSSFAEETGTSLYHLYGSGMLFQQHKNINLAGRAAAGTVISCELLQNGEVLQSALSTAGAQGSFLVTLEGRAGGYTEYTINCYANEKLFASLEDVVFGELWLASGQSNMQLSMDQSLEGREMLANNEFGSSWVRYLNVPALPEYKGSSDNLPLLPQNDVKGADWHKGTQSGARAASAVGFFFAEKLQKEINMPVGLITAALGGSSIYTWLSRDAIEGNEAVLADAKQAGAYFSSSQWKESGQNSYAHVTCNYNNKIHPLGVFQPSGMIWYQGESNIALPYGAYSRAFDLMQSSYSELFAYQGEEQIPIVFTQLAAYDYGDNKMLIPEKHLEFAEIQKAAPHNRAMTSIYDVELTYTKESHSIHPLAKRPVGEKMAGAAQGLLYNKNDVYTAPYVSSYEIKDNSVYVSFSNVGDGLIVKQSGLYGAAEPIYGCTIANEKGIFTAAQGELVSHDTIRIFSSEVENPIAASYAYSTNSSSSNLFSSLGGKPVLGLSPFTTMRENVSQMQLVDWAGCEVQERWHCNDNEYSGIFPTWQVSKNSSLSFVEEDAYQGAAALQVDSEEKAFSVSPVMSFADKYGLDEFFHDQDRNYSKFESISFMIKNKGSEPLKLKEVRIYVSANLWFSPMIKGEKAAGTTISPQSEWQRITLDLDNLLLYGRQLGIKGGRIDLEEILDIELCFEGKGDSSLVIDDFAFSPSQTEAKWDAAKAGSAFRFIFPAIQWLIDLSAKAKYHLSNIA